LLVSDQNIAPGKKIEKPPVVPEVFPVIACTGIGFYNDALLQELGAYSYLAKLTERVSRITVTFT
jgi:hypothetical protein